MIKDRRSDDYSNCDSQASTKWPDLPVRDWRFSDLPPDNPAGKLVGETIEPSCHDIIVLIQKRGRIMKRIVAVGMALVAAFQSGAALAATLTQTFTATNLSFFGPNLDLFDPSLGALEEVIIAGSATYKPSFPVLAFPPVFGGGDGPYSYAFQISTAFEARPFFVKDLPTQSATIVSGGVLPSTGVYNLTPTFEISFDQSFTALTDLADFYGTGTSRAGVFFREAAPYTVVDYGENAIFGPQAPGIQVDRFISGSVTYVYRATPAVPESQSWAMMMAGFAIVGTALRKTGSARRPLGLS